MQPGILHKKRNVLNYEGNSKQNKFYFKHFFEY